MQPVSLQSMPNSYRINAIGHDRSFGRRRMSEEEYSKYNDPEFQQMSALRARKDLINSQDRFERAYENSSAIANLSNRELRDISNAYAAKDRKYSEGTYKAALLGIPALDVFSRTIMKSGTMSQKGAFAAKAAGGWLGVFGLGAAYSVAVNKIMSVSPVARDFNDKHPIISTILNIAGIWGVLAGAQKLAGQVKTVIPKILPKSGSFSAEHIGNVAKGIGAKLDKSSLNTKVVSPAMTKLMNSAKSNPRAAGLIGSVLYSGAFLWAAATLFKAVTEKAENSKKSDEIYNQLTQAREVNREIVEKVDSGEIISPAAKAANNMAVKIQARMDELRAAARQEASEAEKIKDSEFAKEAATALAAVSAEDEDGVKEISAEQVFPEEISDEPGEVLTAKVAEANSDEIEDKFEDKGRSDDIDEAEESKE